MMIEFIIGDKKYTLLESDMTDNMFGYDIYEEDDADPLNLGEIAYFDHEPTQKDIEVWVEDYQ